MSILSELKSRKLGLIELISMGFDVYLKNLKPILLLFCTISLPFSIIMSALTTEVQNSPSGLFLAFYYVFLIFFILVSSIYYIAVSVITDNYVHERNTNYQSVVKKIFASLVPLFLLSFRFWINYFLRCLLLLIPGIIYLINNGYYGLAFILRDQKGEASFLYSRSIVEGNWWRVFFFSFLVGLISIGLQTVFSQFLNTIPFINPFWVSVLSETLPTFITIGISLGDILLFLNLEFQKNLES
ncbi:MAG: hypothetical protein F6K48_11235 [Okeania sp. SIO3H1]|uniref:hypothetical protein n=1 Tax=Okeania sp. SIO1I7 TaxID=2607772 RepID=UPI0013CB85EC|nr:hypothetical protein [Okeania sp. SIO1I7]NEN89437.1 hypothetical protein [Okeania sp. SIO3H1]NET26569.1 hypothetical protein [Okeania sp. SIO1I7]